MIIRHSIGQHDVKELADKYNDAEDQLNDIPISSLFAFRRLINRQFADITKHVTFMFVEREPYGENPKVSDMLEYFRLGVIPIHTTGNDSKVWGPFHNLQFRAIHDYLHCQHELDFTHAQESKVYQLQCDFSFQKRYTKIFPYLDWDLYTKVLRSEIVYQSAYKEAYGKFHIEQKIILDDLI